MKTYHEQLLAIRTPSFNGLILRDESTQEPLDGEFVGEDDGEVDEEDDGVADGKGVPIEGVADG